MQETWLQTMDQEDPLEKEMATYSSILAWEMPWTEEPGRLQSIGSQKSQKWLSHETTTSLLTVLEPITNKWAFSLCLLLLFPLHCFPDSIPFDSVSPFHPVLQNSSYDCLIMAKNKRKKGRKGRKPEIKIKKITITLISLTKKVFVTQSCPTLCNPMDCSCSGCSVQRILRTRILEWVVIPFSRGSSQPRDRTQVSHIVGWFFTPELPGKREILNMIPKGILENI